MTGIALSIALVVVAFVARDVVLRALSERHRSADVAQVAAALEAETQRLSETRASLAATHATSQARDEELGRLVESLKGEVAVLKTTSSLRGPRS